MEKRTATPIRDRLFPTRILFSAAALRKRPISNGTIMDWSFAFSRSYSKGPRQRPDRDQVLTSSGNFQPIYLMVHYHATKPIWYPYAHTTSEDEKPLEVSILLFLEGDSIPVTVSQIQTRDQLQMLRRDEDSSAARVMKIYS
jgi:hypothetical protein